MRRLAKGLVLAAALLVAGCASQPQGPSPDETMAKQAAAKQAAADKKWWDTLCAGHPCPAYVPTRADMQEDEINDLRNQVEQLRINEGADSGEDYPPPVW